MATSMTQEGSKSGISRFLVPLAAQGRLVVIDGGDGSGKSGVLLSARTEFPPEKLELTREPGGTEFAEEIRNVILCDKASTASPLTMMLLYGASRSDHVEKKIRPALLQGRNVLTDRFYDSTYAYQICAQEGYHLRRLFEHMHECIFGNLKPYLHIYLDVDPEEGARRTINRGDENHFDRRKLDFKIRVRQGYLEFLSTQPHRIVDANRPQEEVIKDCLAVLHQALD